MLKKILFNKIGSPTTITENKMWNSTFTDTLKKDLLLNYDKFARPEHHAMATKVGIKLTIRHIDLDESKSIMTTHSWIKLVIALFSVIHG